MSILRWAVFGLLVSYAQAAPEHIAPRTYGTNVATIEAKAVSSTQPQPTRNLQLCGYINGDAGKPYMCVSGKACFSNKQYSVVGCISTMTAHSSITAIEPLITSCRDYTDAQAGRCTSLQPGVGCCWDSAIPACMNWVYTFPASFAGFSAYRCVKRGDTRSLIAWDSTTSSPGGSTTTLYAVVIPTAMPAVTPTTTNSPAPPPTGTPDTDGEQAGGGLSRSDKIALGCGIGIGLPATLAALVTCWKSLRH
ncbi:hypothetical protein PGQ11_013555 [Apiospora arundinis]|uniref:Uncharacterized protein n=1 Tax=Apiospora arundinis TaxID=335852 RepID=A0ABR2HPQ1_9PEZI